MELSFVVDENAPTKTTYIKDGTGTRVSLLETVVGPNASGKTNLLKTLPILKWLLIDSWNVSPDSPIPTKPFMTNASNETPTKLGVVFAVDDVIFEYDIHFTNQKIFYERLIERSMSSERRTPKVLFERKWNKVKDAYDLTLKNFNAPPGFEALIRKNATAISTAIRLNHALSNRIVSYWKEIDFNVKESGNITDEVFGYQEFVMTAVGYFHGNPELKARADEILQKFDLGLDSVVIEQVENQLRVSAKHNFGKEQHLIPINYESSGTRKLYGLLKIVLQALTNGSIAIIDEFDASLHPEMVQELIGMFRDPELNSKRAQLLFSTHSHAILSQLDKYQIVLADKNDQGATEIWRLDDVKGVRSTDNYYAKYIAGAYGAVPDIG